jgi:hypothetical protein
MMITIVSGLPRSGTSLMMQMLSAGGMPVFTDERRAADTNNPRGYYEVESVKSLARNSDVIAQTEGKVVKVVSSLLKYLPKDFNYQIIFMRRALEEVIASQDRMLERLGQPIPQSSKEAATKAFQQHLNQVQNWIGLQPNMRVLYVHHRTLLDNPAQEASNISEFLAYPLDLQRMSQCVERSLHREKITTAV